MTTTTTLRPTTATYRQNLARLAVGTSAAALLTGGMVAGPAQADPKSDFALDLNCGDGVVQIVVPDNDAPWSAGHVVDSTAVFLPVGFAGVTLTVTVLDGPFAGSTDVIPEADQIKNGQRTGANVRECTFSTEQTVYEPEAEGNVQFVYSGTVYGKMSAR